MWRGPAQGLSSSATGSLSLRQSAAHQTSDTRYPLACVPNPCHTPAAFQVAAVQRVHWVSAGQLLVDAHAGSAVSDLGGLDSVPVYNFQIVDFDSCCECTCTLVSAVVPRE